MDCEQYQEALSASALDAESGAEVQAFRLHLEICEACRRELVRRREFLARVDRQLIMQSEAVPSAHFNARLRRRISDEPRQTLWPSLRWLPVLAGTAALAVIFAAPHFRKMPDTRDALARPALVSPKAPDVQVQAAAASGDDRAKDGQLRTTRHRDAVQAAFALHEVGVACRSPLPTGIRIDREESRSIEPFARAVARGQVETASLVAAPPEIAQSLEAKALEFPPITFAPLDPGSAAPDSRN